ncbi:SIN3-HDAC complex-associated factor [Nilaparvata lugens]|uniref:SIN3-HDAC complex-associated factor n=1 Tax=Nilaparvata lugens TaxID=108931 RepID=UPI00193D75AC|nr:SIN3-HDAC complex-associated factor [Nilaparvata lugens]XP_022192000.2 SIN3-HDAC complex-associated factor [Nilaparvata lugens]
MFSFHKPKVYRSTTGCCICKAKSSSSRFTDSRKYENDFVECFQLQEPRSGEVCNACVLLVKRWKKLPDGSQRNWRHVVDARAGPGTKSATKLKSKQKKKMKSKVTGEKVARDNMDEDGKDVTMMEAMREQSPSALSDEINGGDSLSDLSIPPSPTPSEDPQQHQQQYAPSTSTRTPSNPHRTRAMLKRLAPPPMPAPISAFVNSDYWKREKVCCGIIFKGRNGQVLIDSRFFKPCDHRDATSSPPSVTTVVAPSHAPKATCPTTASSPPFSDTSSDSGYDESSNQSEVTSLLSIATAAATAN